MLILLGFATNVAIAADFNAVALRVANDFVAPHYAALAKTTAAQQQQWQSFCAGNGSVTGLDGAFEQAADAWSAVSSIHYGPIGVGGRYERMAHWPERKNAVDKALNALLAREDLTSLTPETFAGGSVAGQGFSALERLLFEPESRAALANDAERERRCAIGLAIANSLATIAAEVDKEWSGPDGTVDALRAGDPAKSELLVTRIATDLLAIYQVVGDMRLDAIMGKSPEEARPLLVEGRRSGRSSRILRLDLDAARSLTELLIGKPTEAAPIYAALAEAQAIAADLPPDYGPLATDAEGRALLTELRAAVRRARDASNATVPALLGVTLGFNSLDGD